MIKELDPRQASLLALLAEQKIKFEKSANKIFSHLLKDNRGIAQTIINDKANLNVNQGRIISKSDKKCGKDILTWARTNYE